MCRSAETLNAKPKGRAEAVTIMPTRYFDCSGIEVYTSPFDRMPSKLEIQGMNEIFNREYGGK